MATRVSVSPMGTEIRANFSAGKLDWRARNGTLSNRLNGELCASLLDTDRPDMRRWPISLAVKRSLGAFATIAALLVEPNLANAQITFGPTVLPQLQTPQIQINPGLQLGPIQPQFVIVDFQATLAQPISVSQGGVGQFATQSLAWFCQGNICTSRGTSQLATVANCQDLVRQFGPVTDYLTTQRRFSASELAACNRVAPPIIQFGNGQTNGQILRNGPIIIVPNNQTTRRVPDPPTLDIRPPTITPQGPRITIPGADTNIRGAPKAPRRVVAVPKAPSPGGTTETRSDDNTVRTVLLTVTGKGLSGAPVFPSGFVPGTIRTQALTVTGKGLSGAPVFPTGFVPGTIRTTPLTVTGLGAIAE